MPENKNQKFRFKIINTYMRSRTGFSIKELTEIVNNSLDDDGKGPVTERTIRNDIKNIQEIHAVTIIDKGGKFRYEDPNDSIEKFSINDDEKEALEVARQAFSVLKGTPFFKPFDDVSTRILGSAVLRSFEEDHSGYIQIGDGGYDAGAKWLHIIYKAIIDKKALKIGYRPFGGTLKTRTISPYLLKEYRNKWYLVAHAKEIKSADKTNVFKLYRIESIETTDDSYFIDEGFNAEYYFKYSLGVFHSHENQPELIRLKFSPGLSKLIKENPVHASMKIEKEDNTGLIVSFYVYNTPELKNLIFSFGSGCTVLAPKTLRDDIIGDLKKSIENY